MDQDPFRRITNGRLGAMSGDETSSRRSACTMRFCLVACQASTDIGNGRIETSNLASRGFESL